MRSDNDQSQVLPSHKITRIIYLSLISVCLALTTTQPVSANNTILSEFEFGQPRADVYSRVESDSQIRYLNPASPGLLSTARIGSAGPTASSVFLWDKKDTTFRILLEFCGSYGLCALEVRGTSFKASEYTGEIKKQRVRLLNWIRKRFGAPDDTSPVGPSNLSNNQAPAWIHRWNGPKNQPSFRLGLAKNNNMITKETTRSDPRQYTQGAEVEGQSGFYVVLKILSPYKRRSSNH